jgi:hypothetical protein
MDINARLLEQAEIRLGLLKNGYTPLGSSGKGVRIKNWPTIEVTEKLIERWRYRDDLLTSGVRVEGALVVMDFDIDHADTLDKLFDAIAEKDAALGRALASAPCRFGGGDKLALFLRSDGSVKGAWRSKAYYRPWDIEADPTKAKLQRLEVFGEGQDGDDARYMATHGIHTFGSDGSVVREYVWDGGCDLVAVPLAKLPVVTREQVLCAVDTVSEVLHAEGWVYEVSAPSGKTKRTTQYRLTEQMWFRTNTGEAIDLAGLEAICDTPDLRVCMDFIQEGAQNLTRGLVGRSPKDGAVFVFDTASEILYRPERLDVLGKVDKLGERLKAPAKATGGGGSLSRLEELQAAVPAERRVFATPEGEAAKRGKGLVQVLPGHMHETADETVKYLRGHHDRLFDMGGVPVVVDEDNKIRLARGHRLAHEMQRVLAFVEVKPGGKRDRLVSVDPPKDLVGRVEALSHMLPPLRSVIDMPLLCRDGRLLLEGYDESTALLVTGGSEVAELLPDAVDVEAAKVALDVLWEPFARFPYASDLDRGGALAAVLTSVLRAVLPTAPMFVFDAPTQGSGKTLLSMAVGELCGGAQLMAPLPSKDEAEVRKVLLSVLLEAPRAVVFDNQWGMLDSAVLAGMLTSEVFSGRLLGTNTTLKAPTGVLVMVTGNNVLLGGETPRRSVRVRIDAGMDAPFTRKFDFCPHAYTRENRAGMVAAALLLVRWALPRATRGRIGSFETWDEMVGQTVALIGQEIGGGFGDPAVSIQTAHADDPRRDELGDILRAFRDEFGNKWFTGADVVARLTGGGVGHPILDAMGLDKTPSSKTLGRLLTFRRDAVVDGMRVQVGRDMRAKTNRFRVWADSDAEDVVVEGELERRRAGQKAKLTAIQTPQ